MRDVVERLDFTKEYVAPQMKIVVLDIHRTLLQESNNPPVIPVEEE